MCLKKSNNLQWCQNYCLKWVPWFTRGSFCATHQCGRALPPLELKWWKIIKHFVKFWAFLPKYQACHYSFCLKDVNMNFNFFPVLYAANFYEWLLGRIRIASLQLYLSFHAERYGKILANPSLLKSYIVQEYLVALVLEAIWTQFWLFFLLIAIMMSPILQRKSLVSTIINSIYDSTVLWQ